MEFDSDFARGLNVLGLERAMHDPAVRKAAEEAEIMAVIINAEKRGLLTDEFEATDKNVQDLNRKVRHLIGTTLEASGTAYIRRLNNHPVLLGDAPATFHGFGSYVVNGEVEYHYQLRVTVDPSNDYHVPSLEEYDEYIESARGDNQVTPYVLADVHAPLNSVYLDFDAMEPQRAVSWLEYEHPEVVEQIEQALASDTPVSALGAFSLPIPLSLRSRDSRRLLAASATYLQARAAIDRQVPYALVVRKSSEIEHDLDIILDTPQHEEPRNLFSVKGTEFVAYGTAKDGEIPATLYTPALVGELLNAHDRTVPEVSISCKFSEIESLVSLRTMFSQMLQAAERGMK